MNSIEIQQLVRQLVREELNSMGIKATEPKETCTYVFKSGKNKNNKCGNVCNTGDICSKHSKTTKKSITKELPSVIASDFPSPTITPPLPEALTIETDLPISENLCFPGEVPLPDETEKEAKFFAKDSQPKCEFVLSKGKNAGNKCGAKINSEEVVCKRHSKKYNEELERINKDTKETEEEAQEISPVIVNKLKLDPDLEYELFGSPISSIEEVN